jgi:membrane peptidoglycan carboxypeptidase
VSNPDLPGPYWQDQDGVGYDAGWRAVPGSPRRGDSPWDDGSAGFWRDDSGGRDDRRSDGRRSDGRRSDGRPSFGRDGRHGDAADVSTGRGSRRAGERRASDSRPAQADFSWPDMLAGRSRRASQRARQARDDWDGDRGTDRSGRFSQTADDLRSRLGVRGAGRGRPGSSGTRSDGARADGADANGISLIGPQPDEVSWGEPAGRRDSRANGVSSGGARTGSIRSRGGDAVRGLRRMAPGAAAAYPGDYGDDQLSGTRGRTALRDQPDDFWAENDPAGHAPRSRVADRPGVRRGGGNGSGGRGGRGGGGGGGRREGGDPRSRGERFKDWLLYGSWWRHWTWKKVVLLLCAGVAALMLLGIVGIAVGYAMTPIPTDVSQEATWQSSSVYFSNGKLLGTFTNNQDINRQLLTTAQIPQNVDDAIIAAEDRNFYHEGGISITGIARAAYQDLFGSGSLQGGSTITEQYAKNYYANIGATRTVTTKVKEIFVAIKLAHSRSKPWILTNYLNTVPFGTNVYGVWAAAEDYFGVNLAKPGAKLNPAQAAMLGAMPNNPVVFSPDPTAGVGYTELVKRWQYVLTNMARDGAISQGQASQLCATCALPQAEQAFNKNIQLNQSTAGNGWTGTNGYLMQMVEQELETTYHYSLAKIQTGGLRITTTFSPSMMRALARAVNAEKKQMGLPYYDHFGISLEDPHTGGIIAIYGGPGYSASHCARLYCDYNMAEAPHPVGSSMKPYVLATAIDQGMDVQNSVLNGYSPLWIPPAWTTQDQNELSSQRPPAIGAAAAKASGWWESQGDASMGPISVSVAAAQSSDPAFTDLAHKVGVQNIINTAKNFGVGADPFNLGKNDLQGLNALFGPKGSIQNSVQIALGQGDLTPIEQASTFATLIDGGIYRAPHVISKLSAWQNGGEQPVAIRIPSHSVMDPAAAADEDYALSFDNVNGTGYPNATWPGRTVIGKTGTLGTGNQASEAWFIGAIPQYAMAVGLWTNSQTQNLDNLPSLGGIGGSFGGAWPAATWKAFMETQFANLPVAPLPTPDYTGFFKWIQVAPQAPRKPLCQPGQYQNCRCPRGQACPNPNPSCQPGQFGQPCGGPSPSPSPSCGFFGQNCNSPPPSPSPSPSCTGFGPPCGAAVNGAAGTGASATSPASSGSAVLTAALSPADEVAAVRAWRLRLLL